METIQNWLTDHESLYEILRYLIAGGLTTLLSLIIHYGLCFLLAKKEPCTDNSFWGRIHWLAKGINRANSRQMAMASIVSWVISVLFAFWINRSMVFRVEENNRAGIELLQFAGGRIISYLLFELGLAQLMKKLGINNLLNRLIVLILVMIFNYILSKFWIF